MQEFLSQAAEYVFKNHLEFIATVLSLVYIILSVKQKVSMWIFGFTSSALNFYVFFDSDIFASASLQVYYLAVSVYGWFTWRTQKTSENQLIVSRTSRPYALKMSGIFGVIFFGYLFVLLQTKSEIPYSDSALAALSIVATWMLARKKIEHWILWIFVNSYSVVLFWYLDLYFYSFLFVVFEIMAFVGYAEWRKDLQKKLSETV